VHETMNRNDTYSKPKPLVELTGAALDHVADEVRVVLPRDDLVARVVDGREHIRRQQPQLVGLTLPGDRLVTWLSATGCQQQLVFGLQNYVVKSANPTLNPKH
jgi:hypothetical protein